jgi:hypothetical protein
VLKKILGQHRTHASPLCDAYASVVPVGYASVPGGDYPSGTPALAAMIRLRMR